MPYLKQKLDKKYEDTSGLSSALPGFGFSPPSDQVDEMEPQPNEAAV